MAMTHDPDETDILDLHLIRRHIEARFASDGTVCADDRAVLMALDTRLTRLSTRYKRRRAFDSWVRNGDSAYTRRQLHGAGLEIDEITPLPDLDAERKPPAVLHIQKRRTRGHGPDAA